MDLCGNIGNVKEKTIFPPIDWPLKSDYSSLQVTQNMSTQLFTGVPINGGYEKKFEICLGGTLGGAYFSRALSCGLSILHAMNWISIIYSRTLATFLVKLPLRIPWPLQSVVKYIARSGMYNTDVFKTLSNICGRAFCKNSLLAKHFSDIFKKISLSSIF